MTSASDAIILKNGASGKSMLDWTAQERSAHGMSARVEKGQLAGHNFVHHFFDLVDERLGKDHFLSMATRNCETAIRDTSIAQSRAHWTDPAPILLGAINDVLPQGCANVARKSKWLRLEIHSESALRRR